MPDRPEHVDASPVTDEWCAAILAAGLRLGVVDPDAAIAWADREIARRDDIPGWLIDLSLSKRRHILDVIGGLDEVGRGVDRRAVFVGVCSLLPDLTSYDFDACEALAGRLYRIAYDLLAGEWSCDLLYDADAAADAFEWQREGLINSTPDQVAADFRALIDRVRDPGLQRGLAPVCFLADPRRTVAERD
jgi:hypothetical protein